MNFDENIHIITDRDRINQVFSNLIKNVIDFVSPKTGIITIGAIEQDDYVEFFVRDNGQWISADKQSEIFKKILSD